MPLSAATIAILHDTPERVDRDYVFGFGAGAFSGWSKAKVALDKRILAALCKNDPKAKPKALWRVHDIRRTVATRMGDIGVQPHVVEAVLNHVSGHKAGVAGVYNRSAYAAEKQSALNIWAAHINSICGS